MVNSYSISGAVIRSYHREGATPKPIVLFSCEEKIPLYHHRNAEVLERLVIAQTKGVLEKCRSFHGRFDKIICTLGEPWVTTFSRSSHLEKREPFTVNKNSIDELVARDTRLFEQETIRDYRSFEEVGVVGTSMPVIDVNGYRTPRYSGVTAKTVDVHMAFSIAPARFVENLLSAFIDVFHREDIICQSMDLARSYLFAKTAKAAVLDIDGTTSTLSIIDRGHVMYTSSIPSGLINFENNLETLFDIKRVQIASVMQFVTDEKFIEYSRDVYYKRIEAAYRDFGVMLRRGANNLKKYTEAIPRPIHLMTNPSWIGTLEPLIKSDLETSIATLPADSLDDHVMYTTQAEARSVALSLAILQAIKNEE